MSLANEWRTGVEERLAVGAFIRPEYLALLRDLQTLTHSFGITLSPDQHADAATLVFAIECVDRWLDAIPHSSDRKRFSDAVMKRLEGASFDDRCLVPELAIRLSRLEGVLQVRRISIPSCGVIRELLANSEVMRRTRNTARFVDGACREGCLMVELLLLLLRQIATPEFGRFMRRLSEPANLADKLRDARRDYAKGELAIRPGFFFHLWLAGAVIRRIFPLAVVSAHNPRLVAWGFRSLFTELILFRFSKSRAREPARQ